MPRQKIADLVRLRGPTGAEHAQAFERRMEIGVPVFEQVVENGKKLLLGRIPGLQQIVVELNVVDRADGGVGVGVSGQQGSLCFGIEFPGLLKGFDAVHLRHAVVDQQQGHSLVALLQPAQQIERGRPGIRPQDAVALVVTLFQVAFDRAQDVGIVVDG